MFGMWKSFDKALMDYTTAQKTTAQRQPQDERRQSDRYWLDMKIRYRKKGFFSGWKEGKALDISSTGMKMWSKDEAFPVGSVVDIWVKFPNYWRTYRRKAHVVWFQPWSKVSWGPKASDQKFSQHGIRFI